MASAILFDFNGVIIDDEPQHCDALIATLAEYGHALDRDTYYAEYLGFDDRECFRFTFAAAGAGRRTMAPSPHAIERKNRHYERAIRDSMRLVPGAADFIENAALDGFQLGDRLWRAPPGDRAGARSGRPAAAFRRDRGRGGRDAPASPTLRATSGRGRRWRSRPTGASWWKTPCPDWRRRAPPGFAARC